MIEKDFYFKNRSNKKLSATIHIPDGRGPFPALVICHGFKRDKNQIIPLTLSRNLSVNKFVALRFDFENCGQSEGSFENLTINQQIEDTYSALDYIEKVDFVDKSKIGLAGLSLGGGIAISAAVNDKRVKTLVAFSPIMRFSKIITKHFDEKGIEEWRKRGITQFYDQGRDRHWKLKNSFLEDCLNTDATPLAEKITIPSLLIQGDMDQAVSLKDNIAFFERVKEKEVLIVKNCDHQYRQIDGLHQAIQKATGWFIKYL